MLRGASAESLLRQAWGQNLQYSKDNKIDNNLVKSLLNLFEIIVVMCIAKFQKQ